MRSRRWGRTWRAFSKVFERLPVEPGRSSQRRQEVLRRDARLPNDSAERSALHFTVERHDTSGIATLQDNMTDALTHLAEAQTFQCLDDVRSGDNRIIRHARRG